MIHQGEKVMLCVSSTQWSLLYQGVSGELILITLWLFFLFEQILRNLLCFPCPACEKMHGVINLVKQAVDSKKNTGASLKLHCQCSPSLCDSKPMFFLQPWQPQSCVTFCNISTSLSKQRKPLVFLFTIAAVLCSLFCKQAVILLLPVYRGARMPTKYVKGHVICVYHSC